MEFKRILIIQTAFLGDMILTTPIIQGLRECYPGAVIDLLTTPAGAALFTHDGRLSGLMVYDKRNDDRGLAGILRISGRVRKGNYDLAVVPHRSLRSALIPFLGRVPFRIGFDRSAGWFLFSMAIPYADSEHEVVRNLRLLSPLIPHLEYSKPQLKISSEDEAWAERFLRERSIGTSEPFVAVAPGSIWATKRWTSRGYADLISRILMDHHVVLIGGEGDRELAGEIMAMSEENRAGDRLCLDMVGETTPLRSAAVIARSKVLVTNDSAPLHMGVAVGTPVCAIFGPTSPRFGFYPLGENDRIVERELYCRPCRIHGSRKCPENHFRCMREIQAGDVYHEVEIILKGGGGFAG